MNKTEIVQAIAEKANLTKVQAKAALDAGIIAVEEALKNLSSASSKFGEDIDNRFNDAYSS